MNYTLSDDPNAYRLMVQYGQAYEGDGTTIEAAGLVGFELGDDAFLTILPCFCG